jgi:hypothetical protein
MQMQMQTQMQRAATIRDDGVEKPLSTYQLAAGWWIEPPEHIFHSCLFTVPAGEGIDGSTATPNSQRNCSMSGAIK